MKKGVKTLIIVIVVVLVIGGAGVVLLPQFVPGMPVLVDVKLPNLAPPGAPPGGPGDPGGPGADRRCSGNPPG